MLRKIHIKLSEPLVPIMKCLIHVIFLSMYGLSKTKPAISVCLMYILLIKAKVYLCAGTCSGFFV